MLENEPKINNALCIGTNNKANIYTSSYSFNESISDNPHFFEPCFVICIVQYINDESVELYFNEKKIWVVNNINKAKKFTYKEALLELYFLNKTAGYGLKNFFDGELQLIDLYIYYDEDEYE